MSVSAVSGFLPVPLVSIVIPAYNHVSFVGDALRSALSQSHAHLELIVIDDGSRDGTADEIAGLLARNRRALRIEFIRQQNRGLAATLSRALSLSRGDYVQFLASDDALFPDMTARLVAAFAQAGPDVAALACDGYVFDGAGLPHLPFSQRYTPPFGGNQWRELMVGNWLPAMGLLYRREALLRTGGFDAQLVYEDWGLLLDLARSYRIGQIPDRLFLYRQHGQNISGDHRSMLEAQQALCARHPQMRAVRDWRRALAAGEIGGILAGLRPGTLDLAARFLLRRMRQALTLGRSGGLRRPVFSRPAFPLPALSRPDRGADRGAGLVMGDGVRLGRRVRLALAGDGQIVIGAGTVIEEGAVLAAGPGERLLLGPGCYIAAGASLGVAAGGGADPGGDGVGGDGVGVVTRLGQGCLVASGAQVMAGAELGDFCALGPGVTVAGRLPAGCWHLSPDDVPPAGPF